jgi:DNA-binding NtrC family response regulator
MSQQRLQRVAPKPDCSPFARARVHVPEQAQALDSAKRLKQIRAAVAALETTIRDLEQEAQAEERQLLDIKCGIDLYAEVKRFEIELIKRALQETHGNQAEASRLLGLKKTTLNEKLKRYKIEPRA